MDFFSKCDLIRRKLQIWSHLLKKSVMENFVFCAVLDEYGSTFQTGVKIIAHKIEAATGRVL